MKPPTVLLCLCLLPALLLGCGGQGGAGTADQPPTAEAAALLRLTNAARAQGRTCPDGHFYPAVGPLAYQHRLGESAQGYADLLASGNDFPHDAVHTDMRGQTFAQRIEAAGYTPIPGLPYDSGENVQGGAVTAEAALNAWLASKDHCPNVMDPDFTEMGMGTASRAGTTYGTYWVQDLGRR